MSHSKKKGQKWCYDIWKLSVVIYEKKIFRTGQQTRGIISTILEGMFSTSPLRTLGSIASLNSITYLSNCYISLFSTYSE